MSQPQIEMLQFVESHPIPRAPRKPSWSEYQRLSAEMWRGINSEIAAVRTTALDRMQHAIQNAGTVGAIQYQCEEIRAWERARTDEAIQKGQRGDLALQSTVGWDE